MRQSSIQIPLRTTGLGEWGWNREMGGDKSTSTHSDMWNRFRAGSSSQPKASNTGVRNPWDTTSKNNSIPLRILFNSLGS